MGFTDDRTRIWAASLNTSRLFIFDVSDVMNPKLAKTIDNVPKLTGLSGPHTPYAIPGRILVSMASGPPDCSGDGTTFRRIESNRPLPQPPRYQSRRFNKRRPSQGYTACVLQHCA
jgi:selenium-binding protein 1